MLAKHRTVLLALLLSSACVFLIPAGSIAADQTAQVSSQLELTPYPDLHLQGEYEGALDSYGPLSFAGRGRAGLQVVAESDDRFFGVFYPGGLPGTGWPARGENLHLEGRRQGNRVELKGEGVQATVADGVAELTMEGGKTMGTLPRVLRRSATLGRSAPPQAIVLFDGTDTQHFRGGEINQAGNLKSGADIKPTFRDYTLHLEFRLPYEPAARSQARGNSGVYLQSRYEVQILDSFGLDGKYNECGALYRFRRPRVNMCLPPQRWQTYDITFRSPRFDDQGTKVENARVTVRHNNVVIHNNVSVERKTGAGRPEGPELLPIKLQDHGDPVEFRNVWIIDHDHQPVYSTLPAGASTPCDLPSAGLQLLDLAG